MTVTIGTMAVLQRLAGKGYSEAAISAIVGRGAPSQTIRAAVDCARSRAEQDRAESAMLIRQRQRADRRAALEQRFAEQQRAAATSLYRVISIRGSGSAVEIIRDTARRHGLTPIDLTCTSRVRALTVPRHEAMYLCARDTDMSLPAIGRRFGGRDHTTILNGIHKHAKRNGLPLPRGMKPEGATA
jgi:chromosomal replication initiation ATPase DnaA